VADRLVTYGKDGSVHARRQAYQILGDRDLVKRLFAEVAPRFVDCSGGYTRVIRLGSRRGDGAQRALLAFSRLPVEEAAPVKAKPEQPVKDAPPEAKAEPSEKTQKEKEPKKFLEGLRSLWKKRK